MYLQNLNNLIKHISFSAIAGPIPSTKSKSSYFANLQNLSNEPYTIKPDERVAQMVIARYEQAKIEVVTELSETERGAGGFGSTGKV